MKTFASKCAFTLAAVAGFASFAQASERAAYSLKDYALGVSATSTDTGVDKSVFGVINYGGGFVEKAEVALTTPGQITEFTVQIPAFCSGVEVVEAGYTHQRGQTRAAPIGGSTIRFSVPAQISVSSLWVTLNGPASQTCAIPVVSGAGTTPPPAQPIDGTYAGTRSVQMTLAGGMVTSHNILLYNPTNGVGAPVVFSTGFTPDLTRADVWNAHATNDMVLTTTFNRWVTCRIPVGFTLSPALGLQPESFNLTMSWPANVFVDVWGRCSWGGLRVDTAVVTKQP